MAYPIMSTSVPWSLVKGGFKKTPRFNTEVEDTATGSANAVGYMPYACWDFEVDLNFVLGGEAVQFSVVQAFLGCFMACCGRGSLFVFTDPNDNAVEDVGDSGADSQSCMLNVTPGAAAPMGQTGDGASTQFQLARVIDQGIDILQNVSNVLLYVDGTAATGTIDGKGVVTFAAPPGVGAKLTWSGSFQYLCRFEDDSVKDLARVSRNKAGFLWSASSIAFRSEFV